MSHWASLLHLALSSSSAVQHFWRAINSSTQLRVQGSPEFTWLRAARQDLESFPYKSSQWEFSKGWPRVHCASVAWFTMRSWHCWKLVRAHHHLTLKYREIAHSRNRLLNVICKANCEHYLSFENYKIYCNLRWLGKGPKIKKRVSMVFDHRGWGGGHPKPNPY